MTEAEFSIYTTPGVSSWPCETVPGKWFVSCAFFGSCFAVVDDFGSLVRVEE
jgi:hypothetical protein